MKTKTFENFNKEFFKSNKEINWFEKQGILKIDEMKNVVITLSTSGCMNRYIGYKIEIIHKNNGQIASHFFNFNDYFQQKNRKDTRNDYSGEFYVRTTCDWYVAIPAKKDINYMISEIEKYISLWK